MGAARKLIDYKPYPQLRKIRGFNHKNKFKYPLLILAIILLSGLILFEKQQDNEKENIKKFVKKSLQEKSNKQKKHYLGKVPENQTKEILELTGINIKTFDFVIENYFLIHTLKKHGNHKQEQKRGQIGIKNTDFEIIPEILKEPDNISYLGKSKQGNILLQYKKQIKNLYFYIVEIRKGKREIVGKTLFKRDIVKTTPLF
jgi:hypothetical protein